MRMNFAFDNEKKLKEFQEKLAQARQALCPGRPLNDLEFFTLLLERLKSQETLSTQDYKVPGKMYMYTIRTRHSVLGTSFSG